MEALGLDHASRTAEITAAMRAAETHMPADLRLFDDPYAEAFLTRPALRMATKLTGPTRVFHRAFDRRYGGMNIEHHLRHRFYEDELAEAHRRGVRQIVLVGAGYDSLSVRRAFEGATIFEVDSPYTQARKRKVLADIAARPLTAVEYVPCDFETDSLSERLTAGGFDRGAACFAIWMGVSYYLTRQACEATLRDLAALSRHRSQLVYDYMGAEVIDGTTAHVGARNAAAAVAKRGEPYKLGFADGEVVAFTERFGYEVERQLRVRDLAALYAPPGGIWCRDDDYMGVVLASRREP
jgi:methyltransferase (TIGR00027 family)